MNRRDSNDAGRAREPARIAGELGVGLGFLLLTVLMTWPWAAHVRDAAPDAGDPYLNAWIMFWDFHQTFHDPLRLFHGNIFYPHLYSLAFSEHNYGLALPFFPLYALGLRPLTAQSLATLLGFAFCGYGAFRLTRTLTGSAGAGWIAGIAFAFLPYRFHHISHVNYLSAGWIPVLLEALVLYVRAPSRRRAVWLGVAFFMNALTCIHWLVLTLLPLGASFVLLAFRHGREKDRATWARAAVSVGIASLCLLPFLLPYRRAAKLYGMERSETEAAAYSATPMTWLTADARNHLWRGLGLSPVTDEHALFPGLGLLLLPLAALLLAPRREASSEAPAPDRGSRLVPWLDAAAITAGVVALLASTPSGFRIVIVGRTIFSASSSGRAVAVLAAALLTRCWIAYPRAFGFLRERNLPASLSARSRPDAIAVGLVWVVLGFLGSFGVNAPFHRFLFRHVSLFRSIRAPIRWAMVCDVGLAVLAGLGAALLADAVARRLPRVRKAGVASLCVVAAALLLEDRVAPLPIVTGDADPDPVTLRLKETPMKGGIVELPAGGPRGNYRYVLRAADHLRPLITAVSGFPTPLVTEIEELTHRTPVPDSLMPLLEKIPTSYVVVHEPWLAPPERAALHAFLAGQMKAGRLLFVRRFEKRDDLYAVPANEPQARQEQELPWKLGFELSPAERAREDAGLIGSVDDPSERAGVVEGDLVVRGWARLPGEDLDVEILIDGENRRPKSQARLPRPDVARVLPALGDCSAAGYEARYAFLEGDAGPHEIQVLFRAKDGRVRHYPVRRFTWSAGTARRG